MGHRFKPPKRVGKGGYERRDDFELTARADKDAGLVMLDFGQPGLWFGMSVEQAEKLAAQILEAVEVSRSQSSAQASA
jgi:hypothetical protein